MTLYIKDRFTCDKIKAYSNIQVLNAENETPIIKLFYLWADNVRNQSKAKPFNI